MQIRFIRKYLPNNQVCIWFIIKETITCLKLLNEPYSVIPMHNITELLLYNLLTQIKNNNRLQASNTLHAIL